MYMTDEHTNRNRSLSMMLWEILGKMCESTNVVVDFSQVDGVLLCPSTLQNSKAQVPVEELNRIQEYLQTSGLAQR